MPVMTSGAGPLTTAGGGIEGTDWNADWNADWDVDRDVDRDWDGPVGIRPVIPLQPTVNTRDRMMATTLGSLTPSVVQLAMHGLGSGCRAE